MRDRCLRTPPADGRATLRAEPASQTATAEKEGA